MAEMIPDRLPQRASAGEKKLFAVLQRLPEDYVVYYEPIVEDRYPDFVIICRDLGLLIIEVKGWRLSDIIAADQQTVLVRELGAEVRRNHPARQARDYRLSLMDTCQSNFWSKRLVQEGEFIFPFGHLALLPYISREQLEQSNVESLDAAFPPQRVVTKDILEGWQDESLTAEDLKGQLQAYFNPFWAMKRFTAVQIQILRAIIHPEIILEINQAVDGTTTDNAPAVQDQPDIKVLDLKQETNARSIGEGHRIIYGVAGSGKTILLLARARLISQSDPKPNVLVLCYNLTLSAYLRSTLADCPNVQVFHFDGWTKGNSISRKPGEENEALGQRFLAALQNGTAPDSRRYDSVLIDEAQDFVPNWFRCVLEAMKDPEDGDLVIVGDASQGLYSRGKLNWKQLGIKAQGRTISAKFDLDKNYRNTHQIVELASLFARSDEEGEDGIRALSVDPTKCQRHGELPILLLAKSKKDELTRISTIIKGLLDGNWFGKPIEPLQPQEIGVLYRLLSRQNEGAFRSFLDNVQQDIAPVTWLTEKGKSGARTLVTEPTVKFQTIFSAKGLQYRAVILLWADDLPIKFADADEEVERQLLYVALTRPENYLAISYSGQSKFIQELSASGKVAQA